MKFRSTSEGRAFGGRSLWTAAACCRFHAASLLARTRRTALHLPGAGFPPRLHQNSLASTSAAGCEEKAAAGTKHNPQVGGRCSIPKGLRPPAQGCEERATLGTRKNDHQPQRGCDSNAQPGRNPVGVDAIIPEISQGSSFLATLGLESESLWDSQSVGTRELWVMARARCRFHAANLLTDDSAWITNYPLPPVPEAPRKLAGGGARNERNHRITYTTRKRPGGGAGNDPSGFPAPPPGRVSHSIESGGFAALHHRLISNPAEREPNGSDKPAAAERANGAMASGRRAPLVDEARRLEAIAPCTRRSHRFVPNLANHFCEAQS